MHATRFNGRHPPSLTGYLFGLLYDCPRACDGSCPLYTMRQIDHVTTFCYLRSLSRDDKLWLLRHYARCPARFGMERRERRRPSIDLPDVRLAGNF